MSNGGNSVSDWLTRLWNTLQRVSAELTGVNTSITTVEGNQRTDHNILIGINTTVNTIKGGQGVTLGQIITELQLLRVQLAGAQLYTHQDVINYILLAIAQLASIVPPPAPSPGDNANAVWAYQGSYRDRTGNMLAKLDEWNFHYGPIAGLPAGGTSWFALYYPVDFID
jgi:hypothetical protein